MKRKKKPKKKQEAQWAYIAHLVFAIYIPLSNYDQRMLHAKYQCIQTSDSLKKDVSSSLLYTSKPI